LKNYSHARGCAGCNYPFLTLKERDNETGLDYFGARYYGSTQGRFTSPDPKILGMKQLVNPQRWNRYTYVVNNPLALYDPDGRDDQGKGGSKVLDVFVAISAKELKEAKVSVNTDRLKRIGRANGYEVNVYSLEQSTVQNVTTLVTNVNSNVRTWTFGTSYR
jgi:RHS repeat-associated protein